MRTKEEIIEEIKGLECSVKFQMGYGNVHWASELRAAIKRLKWVLEDSQSKQEVKDG